MPKSTIVGRSVFFLGSSSLAKYTITPPTIVATTAPPIINGHFLALYEILKINVIIALPQLILTKILAAKQRPQRPHKYRLLILLISEI